MQYNKLLTELADTYNGFDVEVRRGDKTYDFFTLNKDHKGAYSLRNDEKVEGYIVDEEARRITVRNCLKIKCNSFETYSDRKLLTSSLT